MNFRAVLVLPKTAGSAQTHRCMRFIWIVWSTLYLYLWLPPGGKMSKYIRKYMTEHILSRVGLVDAVIWWFKLSWSSIICIPIVWSSINLILTYAIAKFFGWWKNWPGWSCWNALVWTSLHMFRLVHYFWMYRVPIKSQNQAVWGPKLWICTWFQIKY